MYIGLLLNNGIGYVPSRYHLTFGISILRELNNGNRQEITIWQSIIGGLKTETFSCSVCHVRKEWISHKVGR